MSGNNLDRFKFRFWLEDRKELIYSCGDFPNGVDDLFEWMDNEAIIQQSIGLKDKEGRLIYEGDIVKDVSCSQRDNWVVLHNKYEFQMERIEKIKYINNVRHIGRIDIDCIVIGNIYENPELLEVKND